MSETGFQSVVDLTAPEIAAQPVQIGTDEEAAQAQQKTKSLLRAALTPSSAVQVALL
ncbi:MAG: TolC family protein, partial [Alphaproteobacteria bacterium]|nr:TolC family protein [Alphaproteobacteria bacterium]